MKWEQVRETLMKRRESLGLSLRDLAEKSGVSHSAIGHMEVGRNGMLAQNVEALAKAMGLEMVFELMEPEDAKPYQLAEVAKGLAPSDLERLRRVAAVLSDVADENAKDVAVFTLEVLARRREEPTLPPRRAARS